MITLAMQAYSIIQTMLSRVPSVDMFFETFPYAW